MCQVDHKSNDFTLEIVGFFLFIGWPQFGFDHNFDHNAIKKVWRTIQRNALNKN